MKILHRWGQLDENLCCLTFTEVFPLPKYIKKLFTRTQFGDDVQIVGLFENFIYFQYVWMIHFFKDVILSHKHRLNFLMLYPIDDLDSPVYTRVYRSASVDLGIGALTQKSLNFIVVFDWRGSDMLYHFLISECWNFNVLFHFRLHPFDSHFLIFSMKIWLF